MERPDPPRDRLLLEMLYGCGLRVGEAVGFDIEDIDRSERWLRVRGKGRKERQVPYGGKAAVALEAYLERSPGAPGPYSATASASASATEALAAS